MIYLALTALMPWLHLPMHSHAEEEQVQTCSHGCSHHSEPEENSQDHEKCGWCALKALSADIPCTFFIPAPHYEVLEIRSAQCGFHIAYSEQTHEARAPPFQTV